MFVKDSNVCVCVLEAFQVTWEDTFPYMSLCQSWNKIKRPVIFHFWFLNFILVKTLCKTTFLNTDTWIQKLVRWCAAPNEALRAMQVTAAARFKFKKI